MAYLPTYPLNFLKGFRGKHEPLGCEATEQLTCACPANELAAVLTLFDARVLNKAV